MRSLRSQGGELICLFIYDSFLVENQLFQTLRSIRAEECQRRQRVCCGLELIACDALRQYFSVIGALLFIFFGLPQGLPFLNARNLVQADGAVLLCIWSLEALLCKGFGFSGLKFGFVDLKFAFFAFSVAEAFDLGGVIVCEFFEGLSRLNERQ